MWLFVFICVVVSAVQLYLGLVTGSLGANSALRSP